MVLELRNELQTMRAKIEDAEVRASDARRIADLVEQRMSNAQYAADAAEQRAREAQHAADSAERRAVTAQSEANEAKKRQGHLEQELQNADAAFRQEKAAREQAVNDAQTTIGFLRNELNETTAKIQR